MRSCDPVDALVIDPAIHSVQTDAFEQGSEDIVKLDKEFREAHEGIAQDLRVRTLSLLEQRAQAENEIVIKTHFFRLCHETQ